DIKVLQERQLDILQLFSHIQEPTYIKKFQDIASSWSIEKNIDQFRNVTAATQYAIMIRSKWIMPRNIPYAVYEPTHNIETITAFNVLYSAKTYDAFFKTAVYLREITNEGLFVYAFSVAILHRSDTQGLTIPPIYNTFPNFFVSADVLLAGNKINAQGKDLVAKYPSTYVKDDTVVIKGDASLWAYRTDKLNDISYFTHDHSLNALYYYNTLEYPPWLSSNVVPGLKKDRRGEIWFYSLKQLVARYYLERLSNGLGEIPALSNEIAEGYTPGLLHGNGVPFPSRPDNFRIDQNKFATKLEAAKEFERRIWEAIEKGFYVTVNIMKDDDIDVLGLLIQSNADSPNSYFYKDFLRLYLSIIGNTVHDSVELADDLFNHWNKIVRYYTPEQLSVSGVKIEKVETDKLVTFMQKTYVNLTNALPLNENERKQGADEVSVLAEYSRLNHKDFTIKVNAKSEAAKTVLVKFFLAPKYDSKGNKINVRLNTENFFQFDEFTYELKSGENVITRASTDNDWTVKDWLSSAQLYEKVASGKWVPDAKQFITQFPDNLLLPKGNVNGMTFQLAVFVDDDVPISLNYDPAISLGLGSGTRFTSDKPLGYPMNRPLYPWQLVNVKNIFFQDVVIYHEA
ncbi:Storage protein 1, partial [Operophtera brumata]